MTSDREAGVPYPVSDEVDDETGLPIQPTDDRITETRSQIVFTFGQ